MMSLELEMAIRDIEAEQRTFDETNYHRGYKVADLRKAFDMVCDRTNWKNPIRATIEASDFSLVSAAVEFFTASILVVDEYVTDGDSGITALTVHADGYYVACGA